MGSWSTCKKCRGHCCKQLPGSAFPQDLGLSRGRILHMLRKRLLSNMWALDWWEGNPISQGHDYDGKFYYLRPATTADNRRLVFDPSWHGACCFLTPTGCNLSWRRRPMECRTLKPNTDNCMSPKGTTKKDAAIAWAPYREDMNRIGEDVRDILELTPCQNIS